MTIYTIYTFLSILFGLFLIGDTLFRSSKRADRVGYLFLALSLLGICAFVFYGELGYKYLISQQKREEFYFFLVTAAIFSFFFLTLFQSDFDRKHRPIFFLFALNTFLIETVLVLRLADLGFLAVQSSFVTTYVLSSLSATSLVSLMIGYRKYHLFAELEQARLSSLFMSSLILISILAWITFVLESQAYHFVVLFIAPYLWILSHLLIKRKVVLIESMLKGFILKLACIATYFYLYLLLKDLILVDNSPGESTHFFFSAYLFFVFVSFQQVERVYTAFFRKFLFRPMINYHLLFKSFSSVILSMVEVEKITDMAVKMFYDAYGIEQISLFMEDKEKKGFALEASIGDRIKVDLLKDDHPLVRYMQNNFKVLLKRDAKALDDKKAFTIFKSVKAEVCIPFEAKRSLIGLLFLGPKTDGSPYTVEDREVFNVMEGQISVALNNALFFETERESFGLMAQRNKMDAVIALSGGVNHEINNPLSIISMKSQNFLRRLNNHKFESKEEALESAQEVIESNLKNAERAHTITKRLGSFAKPAEDKGSIENLDLLAYIDEVLDLSGRKQLEGDNIHFHIDIQNDARYVRCDKAHLQQILYNLIRNAYHAIEQDGNIYLRAISQGKTEVCLEIQDDGCGISEEVQAKIWEPFFTTKPKQPTEENKFTGTGLGMALVKRYIEHSGGRIEFKSEAEVGTTFFIYLEKGDVPS